MPGTQPPSFGQGERVERIPVYAGASRRSESPSLALQLLLYIGLPLALGTGVAIAAFTQPQESSRTERTVAEDPATAKCASQINDVLMAGPQNTPGWTEATCATFATMSQAWTAQCIRAAQDLCPSIK